MESNQPKNQQEDPKTQTIQQDKYDRFLDLFADMRLPEEHLEKIYENGFDNWGSLNELNEQVLAELGIEKEFEQKQILACVSGANLDKESLKKILFQLEEQKVIGQVEQKDDFVMHKITQKLVRASTKTKKKKGFEEFDGFCRRIRNLDFCDRKLTTITNLNYCSKLLVLQLHSNSIRKIQGIEKCKNLEVLHLENNLISKMEGLQNCKKLQQLHIDRNRIKMIEGLENCGRIEELYCQQQDIGEQELQFDVQSMKVLGLSLSTLNANKNNIKNPVPLSFLDNIEYLYMKENNVDNLENLTKIVFYLSRLRKLDLRKNPVCEIKKFRDKIVISASQNFCELNDKKILSTEKEYLHRLNFMKTNKNPKQKVQKTSKKPQIIVDGYFMPESLRINRNHGGTKNYLNSGVMANGVVANKGTKRAGPLKNKMGFHYS